MQTTGQKSRRVNGIITTALLTIAALFIIGGLTAQANEIGDRKEWSVENGSLPPGWADTLEDASHGVRIIEYVGLKNPDPVFRIKIDTRITRRSSSESNQIFIGIQQRTSGRGSNYGLPTENTGFNFEIDWGDGTVAHLTDDDRVKVGNREGFLHTYSEPGIYDITMTGAIPYWSAPPDAGKWLEISNWGTQELKGCNGFLSGTGSLQIVDNALKFPPVTPNVIRWSRAIQLCRSDYHPAYDTSAAHLLDRLFYLARLVRAPFLDTGECRNFHNFFRSAGQVQGAVPRYNTSKGEFFYRFFRDARSLKTEDIPLLDTSQGRVFEGMFADCPHVTRIPDGYDFSRAGEPFSDARWVPYPPHRDQVPRALSIFAAGHTGELGVSARGGDSGLEVITNLDINTPASMSRAFRKNSGMTEVTELNITIGDGFGLFQESAIERVQGKIKRNVHLLPNGSLHSAFASCRNLTAVDLHLPGWTFLHSLFLGSPIKHLTLDAPDAANAFHEILPDPSTLETLILPNWPGDADISVEHSAMSRDAIMALVDSLPVRSGSGFATINVASAAGADDVTQADIDAAVAKGWVLYVSRPITGERAQGDESFVYWHPEAEYVVHRYTTVGESTFVPPAGVEAVDYLIVAGGGGGGSRSQAGGGGGAGGLLQGSNNLTSNTYTIVVGAGGAGGTADADERGTSGENSEAFGFVAYGGGGGGKSTDDAETSKGLPGGSGGGGGQGAKSQDAASGGVASAAPEQGHAGGKGHPHTETARRGGHSNRSGGGGGGAGGAGGDARPWWGGNAGRGLEISTDGARKTYATGGTGGRFEGAAKDGAANTGNGGGGSFSEENSAGGAGGSGIVVIRYRK